MKRFKNLQHSYYPRNQRGSLVIQLMMVSVVVTIFLGYLMSTTQLTNLAQKNFVNNLELQSSWMLAKQAMTTAATCGCQLSGKTFSVASASTAVLELERLRTGCSLDADEIIRARSVRSDVEPNSFVQKITLSHFVPRSGGEYTADLRAYSESASNQTMKQLDPIEVVIYTTERGGEVTIQGCGARPISAPVGLVSSSQAAACSLSWSASTGQAPLIYNVKWSQTPGEASQGVIGCSTTTSNCLVTGLTPGVSYYFAFQVVNSFQATAFSSEVACVPL
ncbi:MAG: fibronectin type III domain-containing protein [Bdellovibrionaceae bacterium]|nr:fibronectin type III domain-containing protein [Pseudobdellovibrionaceae bacterium]NUM59311.1 fibronectin type III domain-containing protein [Pseudobdellovibrionaceae bacterium]